MPVLSPNANDNSSRGAVNDEAALWHAQFDSGTADERAFEAWRNADPRHTAAFVRIAAAADALDDLKGIDLADDPDIASKPIKKPSLVSSLGGRFYRAGG